MQVSATLNFLLVWIGIVNPIYFANRGFTKIGREGIGWFYFYVRPLPLHISFGTAPQKYQGCDCWE